LSGDFKWMAAFRFCNTDQKGFITDSNGWKMALFWERYLEILFHIHLMWTEGESLHVMRICGHGEMMDW